HLQDPVSRINGVGQVNVFGTQYAMRIWLDTAKLNSYLLTPVDVINAITSQNVQVAGGQLGGTPAPTTQRLTATITEATLLHTPAEFENILLKDNPDDSQVRIRDVAKIELGAETYFIDSHYKGQHSSGTGIQLSPREATRKAMGQITGALVGVAVVLAAVFVPVAFSGGSVGAIYRQFSLTIVSAMLLSVFVALSLTPALCTLMLKPVGKGGEVP